MNPNQIAAWNRAIRRLADSRSRSLTATADLDAAIDSARSAIDRAGLEWVELLKEADRFVQQVIDSTDSLAARVERKAALIAKHAKELSEMRVSLSFQREDVRRATNAANILRERKPRLPETEAELTALRGKRAKVEASMRGAITEREKELAKLRRRFGLPDDFAEPVTGATFTTIIHHHDDLPEGQP